MEVVHQSKVTSALVVAAQNYFICLNSRCTGGHSAELVGLSKLTFALVVAAQLVGQSKLTFELMATVQI